jgi:hypothetical protein
MDRRETLSKKHQLNRNAGETPRPPSMPTNTHSAAAAGQAVHAEAVTPPRAGAAAAAASAGGGRGGDSPVAAGGGASAGAAARPNSEKFVNALSHTLSIHNMNAAKLWQTDAAQQMLEERELLQKDFEDSLELKFHPQGNTNSVVPTPPHKLNFTFKFKVRVFFFIYVLEEWWWWWWFVIGLRMRVLIVFA